MKKLLGLLALTVAVCGTASADQDVLKKISGTTEIRAGWTDKHGEKANEIGNAGFKKKNSTHLKWRKVVSGELTLVDEWNLDAKFKVQHDNDFGYTDGKRNASRKEAWETNIELSKPVSIGNLETTTALGWTHKSGRTRDNNKSEAYTNGISNEIYFGPTFSLNVFGQNISTTLQAVYFKSNGSRGADYVYKGGAFERGKTEGWGINNQLATSGNIYEGDLGKLGYYVELNNKLRDGKGKLSATGKEAKSSVYLDYITGVTYTTPTFAGFYGQVNLDNEWEKHTAQTGYNNTFSIWTNAGYKAAFDTPVGEVSINPFVKYRALQRATDYNKYRQNKKVTTENNEVRAGVSVGLSVK